MVSRSIIRKVIISLVTLKLMLFFMIIGVHAEIDFSSAPVWSAGEGTWAITPSWGDFNQDGWLDIYIGGGADAALMADVIYFGSDTGMATVPGWTSTYIAGSCITNVSDLNNDGYPDVIVADIGGIGSRTPKPQSIYFNQGGYFNTTPDWSSTPLATWATVVGDIDMDGDLDIVCPDDAFDQMSTLKIFINNGGSFNTTPDWESDLIYGFTGGCFSDIDLDGDLDLAMNGGA
ncbi:MAG: VCBS repeat-containing protein, partial [candidate division Zixibacteria bacterium]|nr:VCBS repeat-containing protein [candidate division Zixibacteria bacterium]